ncbi:MAG: bifunctional folylpolyglutamate synthase/dihydrofolate synthase [Ruthenibacterium sp.]
MQYEEALAWVHSLPRLCSAPGPQNERALLQALGRPQDALKFVHVAGTNGKGSAVLMLASVLNAAGLRVGATVSPFVLDFRERFQLNGEMISREACAGILTQVRGALEQMPPAQREQIAEFDAVTAAALLWFAQQGCDIVCLETGLGGRLDATNAVDNTLVACIMAIGKDHTELLGHTYAGIAAEKCGIFKPGCSVVAYPAQPEEAMRQIEACAAAANCPLCVPQLEDFHFYRGRPFENRVNYGGYDLEVPFAGRHQAYNAAVVVQAALALCEHGFDISDDAIMQGIAAARNPARIEVLQRRPLVILDGMHNPDGARALADVLRAGRVQGLTAVMGVLQGKGEAEMLRALSPHLARVYAVQPSSPRALPAGQLAAAARQVCGQVSVWQDVPLAVQDALRTCQGGVLICGSLYLAAQVRPMFLP